VGGETYTVAGFQLSHLPAFALHDGGGAHEPAEARPVGAEKDGHVAGVVDGAHGIGVVVDVRRMQAGVAAVGARPFGLRSDEAHAGAIGVVVDAPLGGEERLDVLGREEVRGAMRAVEHADVPEVGERGQLDRGLTSHGLGVSETQHVAGPQRAAAVAAEAPQHERAPAAEILRYVEAAAHGEVHPRPAS
jgi:hypothetical protein